LNKLLVIGGSGFFGKSIIDYGIRKKLIKHKINKLYIIARKKFNRKKIKKKYIEINFISKDFKNLKKLPNAEFIIYCIRNDSISKSLLYFNNFKKLISNLKKKPKILFTSSGAIYGNGNRKIKKSENFKIDLKKINKLRGYKKKYAIEKFFIENKFKELGKKNIDVSIGRCFNFVGKFILDTNQAIGDMIRDAINKPTIKLKTSINVYRGYMNSDDLINWLIVILKNSNKNCPVFNVGSDKEINLKLLGQKIAEIFNKKLVSNNIQNRKNDYYVPSIKKAKKHLKLKISIDLNDSLNSFIKLK